MAGNSGEPPVVEPVAGEVSEGAGRADAAELQARIEQLEAENEALKRKAGEPKPAAHPGRGRNAGAKTLAVVAALLLALSVPAVWLNRMVTDTDVYVATVAPLAQDPDIQNAVAAAASDAVIEKLDAETRLKQLLPENLQIIAVPVAQAVNDFISKQALVLVRSQQFAQAWEAANRISHKALVTAVTGRDTGAVNVQAGVITLDVGTLADQIKTKLTDAGVGFAANIPTIDKTIVLYESPVLAQMTSTFDLITRIALWLPILGLACAIGAIALAVDRRGAVLWLGASLAVAAMMPLEGLYLGQYYATAQLTQLAAIPTAAAQAAFGIIFRDLVTASQALIALGVVLWIGAIFAGPSRWATAMRGGLTGGFSGVASHMNLGRFGEWIRAHKRGLRWGGIPVALLVLLALPAPRTVSSIVWVAVAYIVWVLLVELLGAAPAPPTEGEAVPVTVEETEVDPAKQ